MDLLNLTIMHFSFRKLIELLHQLKAFHYFVLFLLLGAPLLHMLDLLNKFSNTLIFSLLLFILFSFFFPLFFLMSLAKGLSILFIFSKNQLLVLLIFAIVFFVSISFIYTLIFMISFLLLTLGFVCSFSSSLGVRLDRLFESFLVS